MKKNIFLCLIISLIIGSCAKQEQEQESEFPQGAWQFVQMVRITDGTSEVRLPRDGVTRYTIKMWTENHWMYVGQYDRDTAITDRYGGGTYTLEGTQYEEDIIYSSSKNYEGRINPGMGLELINDTLNLSFHGIDSLGNQNENITYVEKYIRLD